MRALWVLAGTDGDTHIRETLGMSCESCRLDVFDVDAGNMGVLCSQWQGEPVGVCDNWIGPDDPMVLPVSDWRLRTLFDELGVEVVGTVGWRESPYLTDEARYAEAVEEAVKLEAQKETERAARVELGYLAEMEQYVAWQTEFCQAPDMLHFQAHVCDKCMNYEQQYERESLTLCNFARDPLKARYSEGYRAPAFGVLANEVGQMLPRCEMFAYRDVPTMKGHPESTRLPARTRVLEWIKVVGKHSALYTSSALWGVLTWLPYRRTMERDWGQLRRWLKQHWEELGDPVMAALVDVALSEARWINASTDKPMALHNPVTGEEEKWVSVGYRVVQRGETPFGWPAGWPVPWMTEEAEPRMNAVE